MSETSEAETGVEGSSPAFKEPATRSRTWRRWLVVAAIGASLVLAPAVYLQWSRRHRESAQSNRRLTLAVLPFQNLTGDPGQDYFSDGLTEEMITRLGRLDPQRLALVALRTSPLHYQQSPEQLDQIARELGIQYALQGGVRREANKVRVSAQLVQMQDRTQVWAREYDRDLSGLLSLQDEIAQEVADEIQLALGNSSSTPPSASVHAALSPQNSEAYDLYLRGRYFWNQRTYQGFQQAVSYFEQAIAKDPGYARAYAGLADTYALMSSWTMVSQNEFIPKARAAALKALQIDGSLAEAHTSLALIAENYDYDWETAEKEYRRALQLDPNYPTAHQWYAEYLAYQGRFDQALAESERARRLDPLSLIIATDNGAILYFARRYDQALTQLHAVLEMQPNFRRAEDLLAFVYIQKGQFAAAQAEIEQIQKAQYAAAQAGRGHPAISEGWLWVDEAYLNGRAGRQAQALRAAQMVDKIARPRRFDSAAMLAQAYSGANRKDEAFAWIQKSFAEHSNLVVSLKVNPIFDPLRSDPRFQELMHRARLAQ